MKNRSKCIFIFFSINILIGCGKDIEIPRNEIGLVIIDKKANHVLGEGHHTVPANAEVVYYDKMARQTQFDFDFLFKDGSVGYVKFSITFEPIVDSLVDFYNEYNTTILSDVLEVELKIMIRNLMENYNGTDFSFIEMEKLIADKLKSSAGVLHFVKIVELTPIKVRV